MGDGQDGKNGALFFGGFSWQEQRKMVTGTARPFTTHSLFDLHAVLVAGLEEEIESKERLVRQIGWASKARFE